MSILSVVLQNALSNNTIITNQPDYSFKYSAIDEFNIIKTRRFLEIVQKICNAEIIIKAVDLGFAGHSIIYRNRQTNKFRVIILYDKNICFKSELPDIEEGKGICRYRAVLFKELIHLPMAIDYHEYSDIRIDHINFLNRDAINDAIGKIKDGLNYVKPAQALHQLAIDYVRTGETESSIQYLEDTALYLFLELLCPFYLMDIICDEANQKMNEPSYIAQYLINTAQDYKIILHYYKIFFDKKLKQAVYDALNNFAPEYCQWKYKRIN